MIPASRDDFKNFFVNVADDDLSTLPASQTDPPASLINCNDMLPFALWNEVSQKEIITTVKNFLNSSLL